MPSFLFASPQYLHHLVNHRDGETKLGEKIQSLNNWEDLEGTTPHYVLLGIPEDIGVRANYGTGGTDTTWPAALKAILNIQSTNHFSGEELVIAGAFDFTDWQELSAHSNTEQLRELTARIDELVAPVIKTIVQARKIPIVIGGGHNNAYPIIKGCSEALGQPINTVNLDAHSDYRRAEGRHSGNGFRYAKMNGYLDKYAIVALHENYNSQAIIQELTGDTDIHCSFYEDIFLRGKMSYDEALTTALAHVSPSPYGIELDMDCIERVLSSAATPSGTTALHARQYIHRAAQHTNACYFHLPEGAVQLSDGRHDVQTAKLIAYLVSDFIKANRV